MQVRSSDKKDLKDVPKHHKYYIVYMLSATMVVAADCRNTSAESSSLVSLRCYRA